MTFLKKNSLPYFYDLVALFAGAFLPLAFAPFYISPVAIISPAVLLLTWLKTSPKRAFIRGFLFGVGFFGIGASWIYVSLHQFGNASPFFASCVTALFIIYLALYPAVQGLILTRFFRPNLLTCLLAFPASWVLLEWIRAWVITGFPWLYIGYSQINTPLRGFAPLIGIYGLSLITVFTSACLVALFYFKTRRVGVISFVIFLWLLGFALQAIQWTKPNSKLIPVSLIQGNIPQQLKWQPEQIDHILSEYVQLSSQHWNSRIIVWPEAAITVTNQEAKSFLDELSAKAKAKDVAIITGAPIEILTQYYNGALVVGNGDGMYLKRHLVPFGEFMPFRNILNVFENFVQIPMSDFTAGPKQQPLLKADGARVAAFICYEVAYPNEVLTALPQAELLVTLTDDSWFDKTIASEQHVQMGQMRALETGRYILFSTNNGITAIIDPNGNLQGVAPPYQTAVLTGNVRMMTGSTPFVILGIYPIIILCWILLWLAKPQIFGRDEIFNRDVS